MKNSFTSYVSKESVLILNGKNKLEVLDELITHAAEQSKLDRDLISRMTWKREKMMTTGIGNGLALPHIRMNNIPEPVILFGVCNNPIADYRSQDEQPVRVIVFIVAPDENQDVYLQLLGSISRKLRSSGIVQEILDNITRPSQILKIIKRRE